MTDSSPLIGVLGLQGGFREHREHLEALGAATRIVRVPDDLDGLDGIVIPGGESTVLDKLSRAFGLADPLRDAITAGLPVLATCAGLILCSTQIEDAAPGQRSLGVLDVQVHRNAFGTQLDSFETTLDVAGIGPDIEAVFIRAPIVVSAGPGVQVIAQVGEQIVGVRHGTITALSFHPELTSDSRIHHDFIEQCCEATSRHDDQRGRDGELNRDDQQGYTDPLSA